MASERQRCDQRLGVRFKHVCVCAVTQSEAEHMTIDLLMRWYVCVSLKQLKLIEGEGPERADGGLI